MDERFDVKQNKTTKSKKEKNYLRNNLLKHAKYGFLINRFSFCLGLPNIHSVSKHSEFFQFYMKEPLET